ncbi:MAG: extracellular solute-binding protein [Frankiaceae bacterium]
MPDGRARYRPTPRTTGAGRRLAVRRRVGLAVLILTLTAGCGGATVKKTAQTVPSGKPSVASVRYAAELGGLDKLVAPAQKEGVLNLIGVAESWANYGELVAAFEKKYGIVVHLQQPDASSIAELAAAKALAGTDRTPDVFDLSASVAAANPGRLAQYRVTTWGDIPDAAKESSGRYVGGYGGYMSIGYDAKRVPAPKSLADLLSPAYRGKVAINGDPTRTSAGLYAVAMAALGNGGSADDVGPGVDYFARLRQDGNLTDTRPTKATIAAGDTSVVVDWDYTNAQRAAVLSGVDWRVMIPQRAVVASYWVQAISVDAPHPAAARLWQEFLYSDVGQGIWLRGLLRPVRAAAMQTAGTLDTGAYHRLPAIQGSAVILTPPQLAKAQEYVSQHWSKSVG